MLDEPNLFAMACAKGSRVFSPSFVVFWAEEKKSIAAGEDDGDDDQRLVVVGCSGQNWVLLPPRAQWTGLAGYVIARPHSLLGSDITKNDVERRR